MFKSLNEYRFKHQANLIFKRMEIGSVLSSTLILQYSNTPILPKRSAMAEPDVFGSLLITSFYYID